MLIQSDSAFHVRFNKGYELMEKYPNHVPVMFSTSKDVKMDTYTVMCQKDAPLSSITLQFRKYVSVDNNSPTAGFVFYIRTNEDRDIIPKLSETMGNLHEKYHGTDMWLVLKIDKENVFG